LIDGPFLALSSHITRDHEDACTAQDLSHLPPACTHTMPEEQVIKVTSDDPKAKEKEEKADKKPTPSKDEAKDGQPEELVRVI